MRYIAENIVGIIAHISDYILKDIFWIYADYTQDIWRDTAISSILHF